MCVIISLLSTVTLMNEIKCRCHNHRSCHYYVSYFDIFIHFYFVPENKVLVFYFFNSIILMQPFMQANHFRVVCVLHSFRGSISDIRYGFVCINITHKFITKNFSIYRFQLMSSELPPYASTYII